VSSKVVKVSNLYFQFQLYIIHTPYLGWTKLIESTTAILCSIPYIYHSYSKAIFLIVVASWVDQFPNYILWLCGLSGIPCRG